MTLINQYNSRKIITGKTLDVKVGIEPTIEDIGEEWITFANIRCFDGEGSVFEHYDRVQLSRSIYKKGTRHGLQFREATQLHTRGMFFPSLPLTLQCLQTAFEHRYDSACNELLESFDTSSYAIEAQNTVISHTPLATPAAVHYPQLSDAETSYVQHCSPIERSFRLCAACYSLEKVMGDEQDSHSLKNLTGLKDLRFLQQFAQEYGYESRTMCYISSATDYSLATLSTHGENRGLKFIDHFWSTDFCIRPARLPEETE